MTTITFNNLTKADGSALIDHKNTIVQATVFGPIDVSQNKVNYEEAIVKIYYRTKISTPTSSPNYDSVREMENLLKSTFEEVILTRLHPRTAISILVQEIYDGGSLLSAAVNAVCCALIDAGLPMRCPVAGVTITLTEPSYSNFDFVFDADLNIITLITRGCFTEETLKKAIATGQEEAKNNFSTIREKVNERFKC